MKGNKIIATLIVLTMVLSTLVVLNQLNVVKEASAQPGVDEWGYATTNLVFGVTYSNVKINTSTWSITNGTPYYLYYPTYLNTGAGPNAHNFTWNGPFQAGVSAYVDTKAKSASLNPTNTQMIFNRSGMWIFDLDTDTTHSSYVGYIWINTSTVYSIETVPDLSYDSSGSVTVTVNTGNTTGCMIDIIRPDNSTLYHKWCSTSVSDAIGISTSNFTYAGDYTVRAYRDLDLQNSMYLYGDESGAGYNNTYGKHISVPGYNYANIGPWDPPEKNATSITFTVNTGKPVITLTNTTIYWGYKARIDINVTNSKGKGIDVANPILLKFGSKYVTTFGAYINNLGRGNYSIEIPRYNAGGGWSALAAAVGNNVNGSWKVVFGYDPNHDGTYEWNNTASFTVKSANAPVQLTLANYTKKKVDVPAYTPGNGFAPTIDISFDITGTDITNGQTPIGRSGPR